MSIQTNFRQTLRFKVLSSVIVIYLAFINQAIAQHTHPSDHPAADHSNCHVTLTEPISMIGAHIHTKGSFMISYRYMMMEMDGDIQSSDEISNESVFQNYMVSPQIMQKGMHMIGMMYAPLDHLTIMLMGSYSLNTMDLITRTGVNFTTESAGIGDVSLSGLVKFLDNDKHTMHTNLGISMPTGNINQRDDTPMMNDSKLAYPMQLGSGTWDPVLGITYRGSSGLFAWGGQSLYKLRLGKNSENYRLGDQFELIGWGSVMASESISISTSLSYIDVQKIEGSDQDLNPMMMPLFDVVNSGRSQINAGIGANFYVLNGVFKSLRISAEVKLPVHQKVNGIQMKSRWMNTIGIQYTIGQ